MRYLTVRKLDLRVVTAGAAALAVLAVAVPGSAFQATAAAARQPVVGTEAALPPQAANIAAIEAEIVVRINAIRTENGLTPLRVNAALTSAARKHSKDMSTKGYFDHESPSGVDLADRMRRERLKYSFAGENIYMCSNFPEKQVVDKAVNGWMNSPPHRKNILSKKWTETGLGVWQKGTTYHFTQDFMKPAR